MRSRRAVLYCCQDGTGRRSGATFWAVSRTPIADSGAISVALRRMRRGLRLGVLGGLAPFDRAAALATVACHRPAHPGHASEVVVVKKEFGVAHPLDGVSSAAGPPGGCGMTVSVEVGMFPPLSASRGVQGLT